MTETTLGALSNAGALDIGDGYRTKRSEHGRPGYRILRVADVADGGVSPDGDDFVSIDYSPAVGAKLSQPNDVLLTTKGTVGRVAIYPESAEQVVYSPQLCYFRVKEPRVLHHRYLAYWFKSASFIEQASHRANNTDMAAYINLRDIRSLQISLAEIHEQRAITAVLGALDDKIAANDRIRQLCLELADAEFVRVVKDVPFGGKTFGDLAEISGGGTPKTSVEKYWSGNVPWATPTDVTGLSGPYLFSTSRTITEDGLAACSSRLYPKGSILMTSRATIGAFAITQQPIAVNQGFIVVNAKDPAHQLWFFHEMRSRISEFISHANGATFLELSRGKFRQFSVRMPDTDLAQSFSQEVGLLHELASQVMTETATLAAMRDQLLPLLMSGKVRVRDAEKVVDEVV